MKLKELAQLVLVVSIIVLLALIMAGCTTVRPLTEISHTSHLSQHFGHPTNCGGSKCGWNVVSFGIRWRPVRGMQVDVLDGYSVEPVDGKHEVFQARLQYEW